ncbi:hypothetical protein NLJ89_g3974 [Agrocybe chaxingu]|uniref:Uncharacterized protein n=1 Tax=Agrocybe chaxingu TaxID=84603 RepID=A0A9W8K2Z6_9AGAR|nr:hypothetical protein NLJ89_g3974 [Agrocybe chaxingu]
MHLILGIRTTVANRHAALSLMHSPRLPLHVHPSSPRVSVSGILLKWPPAANTIGTPSHAPLCAHDTNQYSTLPPRILWDSEYLSAYRPAPPNLPQLPLLIVPPIMHQHLSASRAGCRLSCLAPASSWPIFPTLDSQWHLRLPSSCHYEFDSPEFFRSPQRLSREGIRFLFFDAATSIKLDSLVALNAQSRHFQDLTRRSCRGGGKEDVWMVLTEQLKSTTVRDLFALHHDHDVLCSPLALTAFRSSAELLKTSREDTIGKSSGQLIRSTAREASAGWSPSKPGFGISSILFIIFEQEISSIAYRGARILLS